MNAKNKIGQRIKDLREKANISQKDLAYSADLDRSYIAGIENGLRNVSILNIEKIASALNVSLKDFFSDKIFENITNN